MQTLTRLSLYAGLIFLATLLAFGQHSSDFERGTIVAVVQDSSSRDVGSVRYDVSVQIRNTIYTVLYTPPNGAKSVEYATGIDFLFLVGKNTLTFQSNLTGSTELPILRTETLPDRPTLDWSKAPGQYFSMKMQHLSESLQLSADQQSKIKPIVEQEAGEAGQVIFTSAVPRNERLDRWGKIVHSSDGKMKPILSQAQWEKLQEFRKQQKQELEELIAKQNSANER